MAALGFALSGMGLVLVWAGVKGEDLREVLADVFSGKRKFKGNAAPNRKPPSAAAQAGTALGADKANMPQSGTTTATNPYPMAPVGGVPGKEGRL